MFDEICISRTRLRRVFHVSVILSERHLKFNIYFRERNTEDILDCDKFD